MTTDISRQAAGCLVMARARRLARWVGEGRPVTPKGVLRPADVATAGQAIGVDPPATLRSAADVEDLHHPWLAAQAAGWILVTDARAIARGEVDGDDPVDDDPVDAWQRGLEAVLHAESGDRRRVGASVACRAVLTALGQGTGPDMLERAVQQVLNTFSFDDADAVYRAFRRGLMPTDAALAVLTEFGCIDETGRVTPLGRSAEALLRARSPESVTPDLPAGALLSRLASAPEYDLEVLAERWLGERPAADAAAELLRAAVDATPTERVAAVDVVAALGEPALPAWQAALDVPELAAYARAVLADQDLCEPPDDSQLRWLAVEGALVALTRDGVEPAYYAVREAGGLAAIQPSGHPGEPTLAAAVAEFVASGQRLRMLQLKISLDQFRPPVWRRVVVPASATLSDLQNVIRAVLGWGDDHLHAFTTEVGRYSDPWYGLDDYGDENTVRLAAALPRTGARLRYVYDFGDSWQHTVLVEAVVEVDADQAADYPTCVGGSGDAPEGPTSFDQAAVNRRLTELSLRVLTQG